MYTPTMLHSDAELLDNWRAGDQTAGRLLIERYYEMVKHFFLNKVSNGVEDLVQETFLKCLNSRDRVGDDHKFRSYLFTIAYNELRMSLRRRYRHGEHVDFSEVSLSDLAPKPSALIAKRQERRLLLEGLRTISLEYQVLLELHYWEKLTTEEMAQVLQMPVGTIRGRLRRARALLEDAMNELVLTPEFLRTTKTHLDDWANLCRLELEERGK